MTGSGEQVAAGARGPREVADGERERTVAAFCLLLCVVAVLGWSALCTLHRPVGGWRLDMEADLSAALIGLPCAVLGFLVLVSLADRTAGWLLIVTGLGLTLPLLTEQLVMRADPAPGVRLAAHLFAHVCSLAHSYALIVLPLTFPAKRRAGGLVRLYAALLAVVCVVLMLVATAVEDPPGPGRHPLHGSGWERAASAVLETCTTANLWLVVVCVVVNASVIARRWRDADRGVRREALAFGVAYLPWVYGDIASDSPWLSRWTVIAAFAVGAVGWYVATAHVVGRGGMWRIDRTGRRILVTVVVVTAVVVTYTAAAATASTVLPGADGSGAFAVAVVAVLIGSALRPLASWSSRRVDHLFRGASAAPYDAVRGLARRLREASDPHDVPMILCRCAAEDLRFPGALVQVTTRTGPCVLATAGGPWQGEGAHEFPLRHHGEVVGTLRVVPRSGEPYLSGRDAELLQLLSDQAAPALAALGLVHDLRAARRQLVLAREEERRRLRRDLHDGLGPLLAAARMHLDTAAAVLPHAADRAEADATDATGAGPGVGAATVLRPAVEAVAQATVEARRLIDGLGPASLTEQGLEAALRELSRTLAAPGTVITVITEPDPTPTADRKGKAAHGPPALPAAVEDAVYRIVSEALANTVRHARATACEVRLTRRPHAVLLSVTDNGTGLRGSVRPGAVGLASMAERAQELGGRLEVTSGPTGTLVRAVLPTDAAPAPPARPVPRVPAAGRDQDGTAASCVRDTGRRKL